MKAKFISVICMFTCIQSHSQIYYPFPSSAMDATWTVEYGYYDITWGNQVITGNEFYRVLGDTTIDSISYSKIYTSGLTYDTVFNPVTSFYYAAIRENNKQIFVREVNDTIDRLHYDFNLTVGDSFNFYYAGLAGWHYVTSVDSILINSTYRRTITFDQVDTWIEGMGSNAGLLQSNLLIGNVYSLLLCYSENGNVIYFPLGVCNRLGTGIKEDSYSRLINIYPNPANDFIKFNLPFSFSSFKISATDFLGQVIYTNETSLGEQSILNTSNWVDGVYFITLYSSELISTQKVIIQHQ